MPAKKCQHPDWAQAPIRDQSRGSKVDRAVCRNCAQTVPFECPHTEIIGRMKVSLLKHLGTHRVICIQCGNEWSVKDAPKIPASTPFVAGIES